MAIIFVGSIIIMLVTTGVVCAKIRDLQELHEQYYAYFQLVKSQYEDIMGYFDNVSRQYTTMKEQYDIVMKSYNTMLEIINKINDYEEPSQENPPVE